MKKRTGLITVSLLVLLAIRIIIGLIVGTTLFTRALDNDSFSLSIFVLATSAIYLVAFIGILTKQSWGAIPALLTAVADMIYGGIDGHLLSASTVGDALIIFLAYKEYKRVSR